MKRFLPMILVAALGAPSVLAADSDDGLLEARLEAHITFLADDLLRGRQPGTDGYEIAARYVASQFRQLGLKPAGADGGYFQPVPLRRAWLEDGSAVMRLESGGEDIAFRFVDEFYMGPDTARTAVDLTAPMVFAGYGIDAPPLEYDDYAGLDVAGKIVVILAGQPKHFPSEEGAHFANGRELARNAMTRGAVGLVRIHTPRSEQRFAWARLGSMVGMPSMSWLDERGEPFPDYGSLRIGATVHHGAAERLFDGAGHTMDELLALDAAGEPIPRFDLPGALHLARNSRHEAIESPNVAAYLPGSDPLLDGEFVVYTAHLDHIGELHDETHDDVINNGALDNASGTAVMLETARLFTEQGAPGRSVLFLAVTAEEKGLVGSEYYAHHPTVAIERMAGLINLDMPLLLYDFGDVIAFGAEHSTLGDAVAEAADAFGVKLTPDPFPEQNIFVRSDHYRFVQQGVPAVFLVTGTTSMDGATDTQAIFEGFLEEHYHTPSDDLNLPIDYRAAARFTRINARIGTIVGNQRERPRWHEGDFFGETFGR